MKIGELLDRVNAAMDKSEHMIDRQTINYYVQQGFLRPKMKKSARSLVRRYDFSDEDLRIAELMWQYHLQGVAPRIAFEKAKKGKDQASLRLI